MSYDVIELKTLAEKLREVFHQVVCDKIKDEEERITDRTLDKQVHAILKDYEISQKDLQMKFPKPKDIIYSAESGITPYDILCSGNIKGKKFAVYINNKFGDLFSNARNDVTTYNNLLRLYLGIPKQRLTSKITIDKKLIYKRVSGREIVSYGIFVFDKNKRGSNFFLLEEVKDTFYINPRNTMFQVKYNPELLDIPRDFYSFCVSLIDSAITALEKNLNATKTEIIVLSKIKEEILKMKK